MESANLTESKVLIIPMPIFFTSITPFHLNPRGKEQRKFVGGFSQFLVVHFVMSHSTGNFPSHFWIKIPCPPVGPRTPKGNFLRAANADFGRSRGRHGGCRCRQASRQPLGVDSLSLTEQVGDSLWPGSNQVGDRGQRRSNLRYALL